MSGYVVSPHARADLKSIWTYTADRWNVEQADRYIGLLNGGIRLVAAEPRRWRSCNHIRCGYFRYFYRLERNAGAELMRNLKSQDSLRSTCIGG